MAQASGVFANLPMRNCGTDTEKEGAKKSVGVGLPIDCHVRRSIYLCSVTDLK